MTIGKVSVLPLHSGKAPRWLFDRMVKLGGLVSNAVIDEYGVDDFMSRLANPYWLQALSNAIGYDWHSSGATTVTMGALKEALNFKSDVFIAGGKGREGTDTPNQIPNGTDYLSLHDVDDDFKEKSRLAAKVDSALVFDDIAIYHHTFVMARTGHWCVVQQAMDARTDNAIRFQIDSDRVDVRDMTNETNSAISADILRESLDMTFSMNAELKEVCVTAVRDGMNDIEKAAERPYVLPRHHRILAGDLGKRDVELLKRLNDTSPEGYQDILKVRGVGRKTIRSLAFISSLIYDKEAYERNPTVYAYNLGGKDRIPYPINLKDYDSVIGSMKSIVEDLNVDKSERYHALRRLNALASAAR